MQSLSFPDMMAIPSFKVISNIVCTILGGKSYWDFCIGFVVQQNLQNINASISAGHMNGSSILHLEVDLYNNTKNLSYIKCKSRDIYLKPFLYQI